MSNEPDKQVEHLGNEIDKLIDRFRDEYQMSYAAVVGVLTMKAHLLCSEAGERDGGGFEVKAIVTLKYTIESYDAGAVSTAKKRLFTTLDEMKERLVEEACGIDPNINADVTCEVEAK